MRIVVDTREKQQLNFQWFDIETVSKKLDTGDYTIEGLEDLITIDRKASVSELYLNFFQGYVRFRKELERMGPFKEKYIVCEFPHFHVSDFPSYNIPAKNIGSLRFNAGHILNKIERIKTKYGVEFIFCDDRHEACQTIFNLLKDFYERNNGNLDQ